MREAEKKLPEGAKALRFAWTGIGVRGVLREAWTVAVWFEQVYRGRYCVQARLVGEHRRIYPSRVVNGEREWLGSELMFCIVRVPGVRVPSEPYYFGPNQLAAARDKGQSMADSFCWSRNRLWTF